MFTKLNAVCILEKVVYEQNIFQQTIPSQKPDRFSKLLFPRLYHNKREHHNKQNAELWKRSTSWGRTTVLLTCC